MWQKETFNMFVTCLRIHKFSSRNVFCFLVEFLFWDNIISLILFIIIKETLCRFHWTIYGLMNSAMSLFQMDLPPWHTKSIWHSHVGRPIWNRHIAEFIRPYIWTRLNVTGVFCPVVYLIIWLPWFDETTNISRRGLVFLWVESRVSRLDLRI